MYFKGFCPQCFCFSLHKHHAWMISPTLLTLLPAESVSLGQALHLSSRLYLSLPHGYPNQTHIQHISQSEVTILPPTHNSLLLLTSVNSITIHALPSSETWNLFMTPHCAFISKSAFLWILPPSHHFICLLCSLSPSSMCLGPYHFLHGLLPPCF